MIITIDGPAGAGKSTAARNLAKRLGFAFLDTGAMYRAVALTCLQRGVDLDDEPAVAALAGTITVSLRGTQVFVDDADVSTEIRTNEVTDASKPVAANVEVRARLVEWQRAAAGERDVVTEGRDQGTVVFPDAQLKFYLTADPTARARRRQADFEGRGQSLPLEQILEDQEDRDRRDSTRKIGPLKPAADAIHVDTSEMEADEVVEYLAGIVGSTGR